LRQRTFDPKQKPSHWSVAQALLQTAHHDQPEPEHRSVWSKWSMLHIQRSAIEAGSDHQQFGNSENWWMFCTMCFSQSNPTPSAHKQRCPKRCQWKLLSCHSSTLSRNMHSQTPHATVWTAYKTHTKIESRNQPDSLASK
jgi:hypothetical protein